MFNRCIGAKLKLSPDGFSVVIYFSLAGDN